jgi:uroporphyrinogen decarboxylase
MIRYTGDPSYLEKMQPHICMTQYWGWPTETVPGNERFRDAFQVVWNRSGVDKDIGMIDSFVLPEPDMGSYVFPPVQTSRLKAEVEQVLATAGDRFIGAGIGFSLFERAWSLHGMENVLMDMLVEPAFLDELFEAILEHNLQVLDVICQYPLDFIYFGDDWGQQRGTIMGPENWRRFIKPRLRQMYAYARKKGFMIVQHSCGDVHELFPDLIEIGLDCYQTFQPEIYDVEKVKQEFGADLSFWGGISTQQVLARGKPDDVRRETIRMMQIMSRGGGYIAAPTHAVPGDVPPENIMAMVDVFLNQAKYL